MVQTAVSHPAPSPRMGIGKGHGGRAGAGAERSAPPCGRQPCLTGPAPRRGEAAEAQRGCSASRWRQAQAQAASASPSAAAALPPSSVRAGPPRCCGCNCALGAPHPPTLACAVARLGSWAGRQHTLHAHGAADYCTPHRTGGRVQQAPARRRLRGAAGAVLGASSSAHGDGCHAAGCPPPCIYDGGPSPPRHPHAGANAASQGEE